MMTKCRALFYKTSALLTLLIGLGFSSCGGSGTVHFCEKPINENGVSENCGTVFTTGELRIVVEIKGTLDKKKLLFKLFDLEDKDKLPEETIEVSVEEGAKKAYTDIELYDAGKYRISVETVDGKSYGSSVVTLVDQ